MRLINGKLLLLTANSYYQLEIIQIFSSRVIVIVFINAKSYYAPQSYF